MVAFAEEWQVSVAVTAIGKCIRGGKFADSRLLGCLCCVEW